ncbi:MAG: NADH dehydrogenase (quinone) subunit D [Deltaproteobacteria bacterium]|nr:NADH dehydrogenase (quinone) subunit D [Candidatus Anaeroferrophillus wilburensis]MBN2889214.1 NADH dehydrogenase (quinone) subunit D [Deltaproteobacteria bacterium]
MAEGKLMTLNMGPHHPSTHGVLRVVLELDGEIIVKATPHIGQLHRGIEKIAENMNYQQIITLTDRLDYTAASLNNFGYCMAAEKLMGIDVPKRAEYIRVIMGELSRIAAHQLWIGTHALDIGAMTLVFYAFRDREMIYEIIEEASGYRLTPTYLRVGGLANDITPAFIKKVREFIKWFPTALEGYHTLLTDNIIWRKRTMNIGVVSAADAANFGFTGPSLRGSGIPYDVRKAIPYSSYEDFDFQVPVGDKGDVFDRYLVRMEEMAQSLRIVEQALENLPEGPVKVDNPWVSNPPLDMVQEDISALIRRFKIQCEGPHAPVGEVYQSVEGSKGELGYYVVGDGSENPYRMKIRSPAFILIGALSRMLPGHFFTDAVAIIGSIDIVLGEVDR